MRNAVVLEFGEGVGTGLGRAGDALCLLTARGGLGCRSYSTRGSVSCERPDRGASRAVPVGRNTVGLAYRRVG